MGIVRALGTVCRELREEAGLAHSRVGYHLGGGRGKSESALRKFETGNTQPQHLDLVIAAYAEELEVAELEIVRKAVKRLEGGKDLEPVFGQVRKQSKQVQQALSGVARATRQARAGSARKRAAKPK